MKKLIVRTTLVLCALFLLAQVWRPERDNPPEDPATALTGTLRIPADVKAILERSCFDCHSNRTAWPWYSGFAPGSWLVASDVHGARSHMNFSSWGSYRQARMVTALNLIVSEVDHGSMPPSQYLLLHRDAVLSEADKDALCGWAEEMSDSITAAMTGGK